VCGYTGTRCQESDEYQAHQTIRALKKGFRRVQLIPVAMFDLNSIDAADPLASIVIASSGSR
jgi:hypothetical protein